MEGDLSFTLTSVIFRFRFRSCLSIPFSASLSFYNFLCSYREQLSQFLTLRFVGFFNLLGHPITCTHKRDRCSSPFFLMRHTHTHVHLCSPPLFLMWHTHMHIHGCTHAHLHVWAHVSPRVSMQAPRVSTMCRIIVFRFLFNFKIYCKNISCI